MYKLRLVPEKTTVNFMGLRKGAFALSGAFVVLSLALLVVSWLNLGIDFQGGTMVQVQTEGPVETSAMRDSLSGLGLGEVALQEFGSDDQFLIRVESQGSGEGVDEVAEIVLERLRQDIGPVTQLAAEFVGPKVSGELKKKGALALGLALVFMLIYIAFRFQWKFALGAVAALTHDVILTFGFFAITRIEFNLASVAAILTIVGYSMNDTVVVYDRVRENLRKYKKMSLADLLNLSINQTLSRTTITSVTTLLALIALAIFGGAVLAGFTLAMIWGVVIGTYSSIFVAAPLLLIAGVGRGTEEEGEEADKAEATEKA